MPPPRVTLVSLLALGLLWWAGALLVGDPAFLPGPVAAAARVWAELRAGTLGADLAASLGRIGAAAALGLGAGGALGLALGLAPAAGRHAGPWLAILRDLPAVLAAILGLLWLGRGEGAAVLVAAVAPGAVAALTLRDGVRALDRAAAEMALLHGLSRWQRFRHVLLPQLAPAVWSAARRALALAWGAVLVVELLAGLGGIALRLERHLEAGAPGPALVAALALAVPMLLADHALLAPAERRAARWRRAG